MTEEVKMDTNKYTYMEKIETLEELREMQRVLVSVEKKVAELSEKAFDILAYEDGLFTEYTAFGFEFTAITLLSLIFVFTIKKDTYLL